MATISLFRPGLTLLFSFIVSAPAFIHAQEAKTADVSSFPSSDSSLNGNHITLRTDAFGLRAVGANASASSKCAPAGSELTYIRKNSDHVILYFRNVVAGVDPKENLAKDADRCKSSDTVAPHLTYIVSASDFGNWYYASRGVVFGALVVPFKFRLGGAKELVSSATIAPYLGFKADLGASLSLAPVVSAGLGIVPVTDPTTHSTSTKAAFSTAVGLVLTSSKNESFKAGLLIGKDFVGRTDRALDPNVEKVWLSLFLGYQIQ